MSNPVDYTNNPANSNVSAYLGFWNDVELYDRFGTTHTYKIGSFLIAMSIALFIRYFSVGRLLGTHLLVCSAVMLILGLFCLIYPNAIQGILTVFFGLFIVIDSISTLSESIYCAKAQIKGWPVLFVLSILTTVLGIAVMFSTFETVMIFAGCSLIIEGVKRFVLTLSFSHKIRQAKKEINKQLDKENDIIIE